MTVQAGKKKSLKAPIPHFSSHLSKIVWWLPMFDFCIFCHLLRLMGWGYIELLYRVGAPSEYLKSFVPFFLSSFSFLPLFSFLFFFLFFSSFAFFVSFTGTPFSSGAPGHCPPMPPSRYATAPPPP